MAGKIPPRLFALFVAAVVAAPVVATTVPAAALPQPGGAPGPLPNGTLPNGSFPNGSLPNGSFPNGSFPNGSFPNGSFPNGSLPNGSLPGQDIPDFQDVTDSSGIGPVRLSRVAWGDYDGDGYDDIMFNAGVLYRNNRDGTFSDVSLISGTRGGFSGGVWGDYNNDGRLDYYATAWQPTWDTLFRNNGDGTFTNVTALAGMVTDNLPSEAAAWADYDLDGCLDLYVANYEWPPLEGEGDTSFGTPNILWHNKCDGTFENATIAAGMFENYRSRGVVWGDYNNDGRPDLYVSNYRLDPNELWMNRGDGTFTNVAMQAGVDCDNVSVFPNPTGACGHSIGADFADYNNDGNLDLYVANLAHPQFLALGHDTSQMYRNRGAPTYTFVDERESSGVRYCETASNPTFADFNADGNLDLFVTSVYENRTNNLYMADRPGHFNDATVQAGVISDNGWGAASSDYDRDGDLDLLVGSSTGVRLFRNDGVGNNSWIELELVGRNTNKAAIGARVSIGGSGNFGGMVHREEVQGGDGTGSQSSLRLYFGMGTRTVDVPILVQWPSGLNQTLNVPINTISKIEEPEGIIDVAVTDLKASPANPVASAQVIITGTVENVGTAPAHNGTLNFYRDVVTGSNLIASKSFGNFSGPLNLSFAYTAPSSGSFTVIAMLNGVTPDDQEDNNDQQSVTLNVRPANTAPVANLTATPTSVEAGMTVSFDGSRSTDDSRVAQYIFDFGDQASSLQNESTAEHVYTDTGTFTARLTVIDDNGEPSANDAYVQIMVRPPGALPPTAIIDSISPASPEMRGSAVTFDGHGISNDATVIRFEWSSDIDGVLSQQGAFVTDALSLGQHLISFKVQDTNGLWSEPATATFKIVAAGSVQITFLNLVDGFNVRGATTVNGTATPPSLVTVSRVQWKVDNGNFLLAQGTSAFSFNIDPSQYVLGPHDITVQVQDSDGLVTTRTVHVVFAEPLTPVIGISPLLLGGGISVLVLIAAAIALTSRGRRKRARAATPVNLRKLPVVAPPPPIRPLPVRTIHGQQARPGPPSGPPKVRVKAKSVATQPGGSAPRAPPPANP